MLLDNLLGNIGLVCLLGFPLMGIYFGFEAGYYTLMSAGIIAGILDLRRGS